MVREIYVVGNWKMYKTAREATDFLEKITGPLKDCTCHVYLAVPYTSIHAASIFAKQTNVVIGAQNMNDAREGAFTGEVAGIMLKEAGASFVILGHSERRSIFQETNELIARKLIRALKDDIHPILCVGESAKEREASQTKDILREQLLSALEGVPKEEVQKVVIAYEPVWAIGSGKAATLEMIEEAHQTCRDILDKKFGGKIGRSISILYGGSVKAQNAKEIIAAENVDGVLVGGASLDPDTFCKIVLSV